MRRFGFSGWKFGSAKQAARRFADDDVRKVENLSAFQTCTTRELAGHPVQNTPQGIQKIPKTSPAAVVPTEAKNPRTLQK